MSEQSYREAYEQMAIREHIGSDVFDAVSAVEKHLVALGQALGRLQSVKPVSPDAVKAKEEIAAAVANDVIDVKKLEAGIRKMTGQMISVSVSGQNE